MSTETGNAADGDILLEMRGLKIEGQADDQWHEIVHGIDLDHWSSARLPDHRRLDSVRRH